MSRPVLALELEQEFRAVADGVGCELVHVGFHGNVLRVTLDHLDGVTHEHCTSVARQLSALLDVDDFGTGRYVLEVSSPGLDRPLYRPADWQRFVGNLVRVTYIEREDGETCKRTLVGRLKAFEEGDGGRAQIADDSTGSVREISLVDVERARLEIDL
jgi:ribosome maturation factor RimP